MKKGITLRFVVGALVYSLQGLATEKVQVVEEVGIKVAYASIAAAISRDLDPADPDPAWKLNEVQGTANLYVDGSSDLLLGHVDSAVTVNSACMEMVKEFLAETPRPEREFTISGRGFVTLGGYKRLVYFSKINQCH